jgi:LytS/YehU family sensor histidine kinase
VFVIIIRLPMLNFTDNQPYYLSQLIVSMFLHIVIFYIFYLLLGKILIKKGLLFFVGFFVPFILLYSIPVTYFFIAVFDKLMALGVVKEDPQTGGILMTYASCVATQSIYAIMGTLFRVAISWYNNQKYEKELEKQNVRNELALLRSQINPHFLFNTLNNIHSFVYRDQDRTSFGIIKLSEIMRYMLYETNADRVLLEKEIKCIENYIELQKLRLKDPAFIQFTVEGNIHGIEIPPLLLITFVENAFKHGKKNGPSPGIVIHLKTEGKTLLFEVLNYILPKDNESDSYKGFGLNNLQRRLDLIYGKTFKLDRKIEGDKYTVRFFVENV